MLPIIALIGRTNVGKSTLFNLLTKNRNALVGNYPGLTRDRQYGSCFLKENIKILLTDTAGLDIQTIGIEEKTHQQTLQAIEEANIILFLVDARDGLMPQELEITKKIRTYEKKIILIINKIDGIQEFSKINEFYSLGFKNYHAISASHNQGIKKLISKYLIPWIKNQFYIPNLTKNLKKKQENAIKIAFIGKPNVGKSTLINALLKKERMITFDKPGTTLDSISTPIIYHNKKYILIDTAGHSKQKKKFNKIERFSMMKTLQTIEKTDVVLLIIDAHIKICNQDLSLSNFIINAGKSIVIVLNKWDLLNSLEKKELKDIIIKKLHFVSFARIHFISALYQSGIFLLFQSIDEAYKASQIKINTAEITRMMYQATKKHQPPMIQGRRIKLKYAHLGSSNPPSIIIHGNQMKHLSNSYKKYLINFFYDALNLRGTPIKIKFKEKINPYIIQKSCKKKTS